MITDKIKARHLDESLLELINKPSVSSWNDLTDRPFGEIEAEVEKVYFDFNGDIGADVASNKVYGSFIKLSDKLIAGQSYNITYNGVLYENCVAIDTNGTISVECNTENGYVKIYDYVDHSDWLAIQDTTGDEENLTASIKLTSMAKDTVIKKLDGKYLPEGYPYVEGGSAVEILPETTLTEEQLQNDGLFYPSIIPDANKQYTVIWNGVAYITTAIEVTENDITGVVLGDAYTASNGAMGNSATGEPFCLVYYPAAEKIIAIVNALDDSTTVTLSIYQQNETIHTMDPKFLPLKFIEGSGAATDTLTFDGNLEGKEYILVDEDMYFVHISDTFIDSSELIDGTITIVSNDEENIPSGTYPIIDSEDMITDMSPVFGFPVYGIGEFIFVLSQPVTQEGLTLPKGINFMYAQDVFYVSELKAPKAIFNSRENILLLDPEYIKDMYYEKKEEEIFQYSNGFSDENGLALLGSNLTLSPFSTSFITENNQYTIIVNDIEYSNYNIVSEVDFDGATLSGKSIMVYATNLIEGLTNLIQISEGIVQGYNAFMIHINNVSTEAVETNPNLYDTKITVIKNNNIIKQIDPKYIPTSIQSDWAENDENSISYIQNRPFYDEIEYSEIITETLTGELTNGYYGVRLSSYYEPVYDVICSLTNDTIYGIKINESIYHCKMNQTIDAEGHDLGDCGNSALLGLAFGTDWGIDTGEPFYMWYSFDDNGVIWKPELGDTITFGIYNINSVPVPIDEKYLPDTVATKEFVANEVDTLKKSVSDGKSLVAGAITEKGIITAADATFATMAGNINKITTLASGTSDATVATNQMLSGVVAYGKNGARVVGNIASQGAQTITPGTTNKTIPANTFLSGVQTIAGDADLKAANIKSGVNIFGVTGTYAGQTINGVIESYKVAAGNTISAGDFVSFLNGISAGTDTNLSSVQYSGYFISAVELGGDKVFIAHSYGDSGHLYAMVCTISGTTITKGTDTLLSSAYYAGRFISTVKLSDSKVFIAHKVGYSESTLNAIVCTISGTSITKGTDTKISSTSNTGANFDAVALNESKVFIAYNYGTALQGTVCTISGTTISNSTGISLGATCSDGSGLSVVALNESTVFIAHGTNASAPYLYAIVCTISGTSITKGTDIQLSSVQYSGYRVRAVPLAGNRVFIAHSYSSSNHLYAMVCTISGTTITKGTDTLLSNTSSSAVVLDIVKLNNSKIYIAHCHTTNMYYLYCMICEVIGTSVVVGDDIPVLQVKNSANVLSNPVLMSDGNVVILRSSDVTDGLLNGIVTSSGNLCSYNGNILGVAKTGGSEGATVQVYVPN